MIANILLLIGNEKSPAALGRKAGGGRAQQGDICLTTLRTTV